MTTRRRKADRRPTMMRRPPGPIEHRVEIRHPADMWLWEWHCSCGERSFMEWLEFTEAKWWAGLHLAATR